MLTEEIERMYKTKFNDSRGLERSQHGEHDAPKPFTNEKYHDIAIRASIRMSVKRRHEGIQREDIRAYENISRPNREIVLAVDVSGSMKGDKIVKARRAFAALLAHSMNKTRFVGLLLFNTEKIKRISCKDKCGNHVKKFSSKYSKWKNIIKYSYKRINKTIL
jgi:Mg-chelatase subunit ChlD